MEGYQSRLRSTDWSSIYSSQDPDTAWSAFKTTLTTVLDSVAPQKTVRIKQNNLGYNIKSKSKSKIVLRIAGKLCHDTLQICNYVNEFFTTVAANLVKKMPNCDCKYGVDSQMFKDFYKAKGIKPGAFKLKPVTTEYIEKELLCLDARKSTGLDYISPRFLKEGVTFLYRPIAHIINSSIATGLVPGLRPLLICLYSSL